MRSELQSGEFCQDRRIRHQVVEPDQRTNAQPLVRDRHLVKGFDPAEVDQAGGGIVPLEAVHEQVRATS